MKLQSSADLSGIAVVGMAGRFPGANNVHEFWRNLAQGCESITFFTEAELIEAGVSPEVVGASAYVRARGCLEAADYFDAAFFGFTPREAIITDPQHRVFLECAWEALEVSGYNVEDYEGAIGVYSGVSTSGYQSKIYGDQELSRSVNSIQIIIGNDKDFLPTRVSYKLNLKGPSINVQTACSTSLVAVHTACQALLDRECDVALAGGVSINAQQTSGYFYEEGGIFSPDGHCRAFDAKAQGAVRGCGVGVVALKRLADAVAERDHIYAVIKGSAINNDGSGKVGFTAPGLHGQAEVITEALAVADISPQTVSYVETHGTGTTLGDPIEIGALTKAFRAGTDQTGYCAIGSLKTNIGHLDAAAGVAGLIKTILALQHRALPPSLNFEQPNPNIDFASSPFYVNSALKEWKTDGVPRRAGVSSFGIGGTNAHVVLEEAPAVAGSGVSQRSWQMLLLSAKTGTALEAASANLAAHLEQHDALNLADAAYTLQAGRRAFKHRRFVVCQSAGEAVAALRGGASRRVLTATEEVSAERRIALMFSGQGTQRANMARGLYREEPMFRAEVDRCAALLKPMLGCDLRQLLFPREGDEAEAEARLARTAFTQPALFTIEYALGRLWMEWCGTPQAMIGHSVGEYVAACLAGVFTLETALGLIAARGRLMEGLPQGAMLALPLTEQELKPLLGAHLSIAAVNGESLCVVSGTEQALAELERKLDASGIEGRRLRTSHAFHSAMMEPILAEFTKHVGRAKLSPPTLPYVSNVTGDWIKAEEATSPDYWVRHLRQTVRFSDGLSRILKDPRLVLIEVGAGQTLCNIVKDHPARTGEHVVLASLPKASEKVSDAEFLLTALGRAWLAGVKPSWEAFHRHEQRSRLPLPTYPFERQCYRVGDSTARRRQQQQQPRSAASDETKPASTAHEPRTTSAGAASALAVPHVSNAGAFSGASADYSVPTGAARRPEAGNGHGGDASHVPEHTGGASPFDASAGMESLDNLLEQQLQILSQQLTVLQSTQPESDLNVENEPATTRTMREATGEAARREVVGESNPVERAPATLHAALSSPTLSAVSSQTGGGETDAMRAEADAMRAETTAAAVAATPVLKEESAESIPLTPIQHFFFEQQLSNPHHWNQWRLFRLEGTINFPALEQAWRRVVEQHEALRLRFVEKGGQWEQRVAGRDASGLVRIVRVDLSDHPAQETAAAIETVGASLQSSLNLSEGPLMRLALFEDKTRGSHRLLIIIHHLLVDNYSWWILLNDLQTAYEQLCRKETVSLPPATAQYKFWPQLLKSHLATLDLEKELLYCRAQLGPKGRLPLDFPNAINTQATVGSIITSLDREETHSLLFRVAKEQQVMVSNLLLAALRSSFREWTGSDSLLVDLEGHGREAFFEEIDLSRTVGWFTSIYPVLLEAAPNASPFEALRQIREQIVEASRHEVSYGLLRYLSPEPGVSGFLREFPSAEISFNYAGKFKGAAPIFMPTPERVGPSHDPAGKRFYLLEISGSIVKDQLRLAFRYGRNVHRQATIERLAKGTIEALKTLISGSA